MATGLGSNPALYWKVGNNMQGSLYIMVGGGTWINTTDPDYEQKMLCGMMHDVCGSPICEGQGEEIARLALSDNRLNPSQQVQAEFENLMECMEFPAARKLFRPGNIPTRDGADPDYHTVLAETLQMNSGVKFQNFFAWVLSTPKANATLVQAYDNLLRFLHRQEEHYLPHFKKALAKHPFAPDYAFVTGLAAAGVNLDEHDWLHSFGYFQQGQDPYNVE